MGAVQGGSGALSADEKSAGARSAEGKIARSAERCRIIALFVGALERCSNFSCVIVKYSTSTYNIRSAAF